MKNRKHSWSPGIRAYEYLYRCWAFFFHFAYVHRSFIISVIKAIHKGEVLRK